jgi:ATP-dependent helicase YprA (DUF1998 family)
MGENVNVYQKPLSGSGDQDYQQKVLVGDEVSNIAFQRFHKGAIYTHRTKSYLIIESKMRPNETVEEREVLVKPVNVGYFTKTQSKKSPHIPNEEKARKKIIEELEILHTDMNIDKTPTTYTRRNKHNWEPMDADADGKATPIPVIDAEKFIFNTKGVVLKFPIDPINDLYEVDPKDNPMGHTGKNVKPEVINGLHAIEHLLQHAAITKAGISPENIDGVYDKDPSATKFKKIYIFDNSGDGESGATEAIYYNIEETIRRAFEIISDEHKECDGVAGCVKCTFQVRKCTQFNRNLNKPVAIKKLEKVVIAIFEEKLKEYKDTKWSNKEERLDIENDLREKYGKLLNMESRIDEINLEFEKLNQ